MQYTIDVTATDKITALSRAATSYNTINKTTLTDVQFLQLITDQNLDAFVAIHTKNMLTKYEFMNRFTQAERVTIRTAAASSGELYDFISMLELATEVQLDYPATQGGVQFLETSGLIAAGRAATILAV